MDARLKGALQYERWRSGLRSPLMRSEGEGLVALAYPGER
jgi:hypothetical protein